MHSGQLRGTDSVLTLLLNSTPVPFAPGLQRCKLRPSRHLYNLIPVVFAQVAASELAVPFDIRLAR